MRSILSKIISRGAGIAVCVVAGVIKEGRMDLALVVI
jgi:hypothetical protein